jgi:caspase 9
MDSDPRGFLLIINNQDFQRGLSTRDGTDIDCEKLKTLFMSLGFGVDVRHNLTALVRYVCLCHLITKIITKCSVVPPLFCC